MMHSILQWISQIDLTTTLLLLAKFTLYLAFVLFVYRLFARQSAEFRHVVLSLSLLAAPLLIACQLWAPGWSLPSSTSMWISSQARVASTPIDTSTEVDPEERDYSPPESENPFLHDSGQTAQQNDSEHVLLPAQSVVGGQVERPVLDQAKLVIFAAWCFGALIFLGRIAIAWLLISRRVAVATPLQYLTDFEQMHANVKQLVQNINSQNVKIRVCNAESQMPLGIGLLHKTILLPSSCFAWSSDQWRSVLMHEHGHFIRSDCWTNLFARVQQAVFWFHPLTWIVVRQIRSESEMACDDRVIRGGVPKVDYAAVLFQVASGSQIKSHETIATVTMCESSEVECRMRSILSTNTTRQPITKMGIMLIAVALIASTLPIATAQLLKADETSIVDEKKSEEAPESLSFEIVVKLENGDVISGTSSDELELLTGFGRAFFDVNLMRSVKTNDDGKLTIASVDGSTVVGTPKTEILSIETDDGSVEVSVSNVKSINVVAHAKLVPGEITDGVALNDVTYHIRAPKDYLAGVERPAIVIFHGSNSNSKDYINTIVAAWPDIATDYILIGINGEYKNKKSKPEHPTYNYTYVNFAGKSVYKGFEGTDRESPALVSEVITEIREFLPISKLFVGGHSQGGFLTYSVMMNYPDLIDGAFPISGGMIIQCDPFAYDKEELRQLQRKNPVVIVHSKQDNVVNIALSESAYTSYLDDGFPMLRFMNQSEAGHAFARLPVGKAIRWLENMTTDNPKTALVFADQLVEQGQLRDASALLNRLAKMEMKDDIRRAANNLALAIEDPAASDARVFVDLIKANENGEWIEKFHEFRSKYEYAPFAEEAMTAFNELRKQQDPEAKKLFSEVRKLFRQQKQTEARQMCQEIVDNFYASSKYRLAQLWLKTDED